MLTMAKKNQQILSEQKREDVINLQKIYSECQPLFGLSLVKISSKSVDNSSRYRVFTEVTSFFDRQR